MEASVQFPASFLTQFVAVNGTHGDFVLMNRIEVIKGGAFVDRLFDAAPARTSRAIAKSLNDLTKPPYSKAELIDALRLHGAKATAEGLRQVAG